MAHTRKKFLTQRRQGANKSLRKRGSALRLCAFARGKLTVAAVGLLGLASVAHFSVHTHANAENVSTLIEAALYTRHEFFGAQAIVPFPTAEARNRLAEVHAKYPDNPQIYLKLSQLDEKLGNEESALQEMQAFVKHEPDQLHALETLAEFLDRRAQFAAEAEALERMLHVAPPEQRVEVFRRLLTLAQTHLLEKYLTPRFYEQTIVDNPAAYEIVEQYQQKLIDNGDPDKALALVRQNRDRFPQHYDELVEKEASLLADMGQLKRAEEVYKQSFEPFWSSELA